MTSSNSGFPAALTPKDTAHAPRKFATLRTISALILREMSTKYGRTPGGYIWTIVGPLASVLFLSVGFSLLLRTPSLGTSFLLFYATGFMFFASYQTTEGPVSKALRASRPLLKYPAVTWVDTVLATFILNALTGTLTAIILIGGILLYLQHPVMPDVQTALLAASLAFLLGFSLGTLNCALSGLFPLWSVVWGILTRPLFLASAIIYIYEDLPDFAQKILWWNPLVHITGLARSAFYPTYHPDYISLLYVSIFSMIVLNLGLILIRRYHRVILNR
jgi:capsular polysaccharide transport system permease protein